MQEFKSWEEFSAIAKEFFETRRDGSYTVAHTNEGERTGFIYLSFVSLKRPKPPEDDPLGR